MFKSSTHHDDRMHIAARIWQQRFFLFLFALTCGIAAAFIANHILEEKMVTLTEQTKRLSVNSQASTTERKATVLVARVAIKPGMPLGEHNLATRAVPQEWVPSYALMASDLMKVENQASAYPLKPGDMVIAAPERWQESTTYTNQEKRTQYAVSKAPQKIMVLYGNDTASLSADTATNINPLTQQ